MIPAGREIDKHRRPSCVKFDDEASSSNEELSDDIEDIDFKPISINELREVHQKNQAESIGQNTGEMVNKGVNSKQSRINLINSNFDKEIKKRRGTAEVNRDKLEENKKNRRLKAEKRHSSKIPRGRRQTVADT